MDIKGIPGSWKARFESGSWQVQDNDGHTIASIKKGENEKYYARMIAASPYMLEALRGLLDLISEENLPDSGELSGGAICDLARSAVVLATNEEML